MIADWNHDDYRRMLQQKATEAIDSVVWKPPGKYRRSTAPAAGGFVPVDYPGFTVLGTPYPLPEGTLLGDLQDQLKQVTPAFASVPPDTFHVTLADLVAGEKYRDLTEQDTDRLRELAGRIVRSWTVPRPIRATLNGLGAFPGVIVALVDFPNDYGYDALVELRRRLYGNADLQELGVRKEFRLTAHVTLGYVEANAVDAPLLQVVTDIRERFQPVGFEITGALVCEFPNMSRYDVA